MNLPVLTAVGDASWEAELASGLGQADIGVEVVRRCVDLADLIAVAASGIARAVVLSADLRRLDRDALGRLGAAGVAVVGLVRAGDDSATTRLHQLGVSRVVTSSAPAADVAAAVQAAIAELNDVPVPVAVPVDPGPRLDVATETLEATRGAGRVIAVWGPTGGPGRSTVAVNLAAELVGLGHSVMLVDADSYGGAVAAMLGILDESPGLAAACRLANSGRLNRAELAAVALELRPAFRVLTGISRSDRWLELRPTAIAMVLGLLRSLASYVVVDCGFCLEQDEELAYDTAAPRRNGATLAVLTAADLVIGVSAADPVGLARYVRALPECGALCAAPPLTVVNRVRKTVVGAGDPRRQVTAALDRYAGIRNPHLVPEDREALDRSLATARSLAETSPKSPARIAIRDLAARIADSGTQGRGRRRR